jgi:hypothetical protein
MERSINRNSTVTVKRSINEYTYETSIVDVVVSDGLNIIGGPDQPLPSCGPWKPGQTCIFWFASGVARLRNTAAAATLPMCGCVRSPAQARLTFCTSLRASSRCATAIPKLVLPPSCCTLVGTHVPVHEDGPISLVGPTNRSRGFVVNWPLASTSGWLVVTDVS